MSIWTNRDQRATLDDDVGDFSDSPTGGRVKQWLAGVAFPLWPILFGIYSLIMGSATFFGRGGSLVIHGHQAMVLNIAYIAIGLFVHFHYFWGLSTSLYRFSQALKATCLAIFVLCVFYALCSTIALTF